MADVLSGHSQARLKEFFKSGTEMLQEMEDRREALKDLTKTVSEELNVKPADLTTALKVYYKNKIAELEESNNTVSTILAAVS